MDFVVIVLSVSYLIQNVGRIKTQITRGVSLGEGKLLQD